MANGAEKSATTVWQGDLAKGSGTFDTASGTITGQSVSWASRTGDANGKTSPEELLAAAHSSCFSMALSHELSSAGSAPERLEVTATVAFTPKQGGGFQVSSSKLKVTGSVPGIDEAKFKEAAQSASQNCPVSQAIKGNVEISVDATLA